MNNEIQLSVVIPCFNDGHFLVDAVASAEAGQGRLHEIIIVNDGSTDPKTLEVLKGMEDRGHRVIHQANHGLGFSRNAGISASRGTYILPLDSDNRIRPEYIQRATKLLNERLEVDVVYGDAEYFGDRTGTWKVPEFSLPQMLEFNYIDACAVFRRSAWERVGGYDPSMPVQGYEDWDFWLRIALTGGGFHHVSEVLFDYRVRKGSMSAEMGKPENTRAVIQYIRSKRVPIPIGLCADLSHSVEVSAAHFRKQPIRFLARLCRNAFLPALKREQQ